MAKQSGIDEKQIIKKEKTNKKLEKRTNKGGITRQGQTYHNALVM